MNDLADDIAERLHHQVDTVSTLVGLDVHDFIAPRIASVAQRLADDLMSGDRRLAAQTAIDLSHLTDPHDPDDAASALGVAIALTDEHTTFGATKAAQILGVTRARIYQLVDAGLLERGGDGLVTRASVARRLLSRPRDEDRRTSEAAAGALATTND